MSYTNRDKGLSFDPWDSATLTQSIRRPLETKYEGISTLGQQIAPLFSVQTREISIEAREVSAFGAGQFRAPDATPPLVEFDASISRAKMELVLLDEMRRIKEEDWLNLTSPDPRVKEKVVADLLTQGEMLAIRNRRLTENLRWEAFTGEATIVYGKGTDAEASYVIDYGIPASNNVRADDGAGADWTNHEASDPIGDIKRWAKIPTRTVGFPGVKVHLSTEAMEHMLASESLKAYLTGNDRGLWVATIDDVKNLLPGIEFIIEDSGYREEGTVGRGKSDLKRYLPVNMALITTEYNIDGESIADMADGLVTVAASFNSTRNVQGEAAEVKLDNMSLTHYLRYASARIPRLNHPGAFVWANLGDAIESDY